jgi:hypothetical protein
MDPFVSEAASSMHIQRRYDERAANFTRRESPPGRSGPGAAEHRPGFDSSRYSASHDGWLQVCRSTIVGLEMLATERIHLSWPAGETGWLAG